VRRGSRFQACQTRDNEASSKLILLHCGGEYGFLGTSGPAGTLPRRLEHSAGNQRTGPLRSSGHYFAFVTKSEQESGEWLGLDQPLSHCPRRVHSRAREALEVVLAHRLHLGWSGSNAAKLRADAKAGGGLAEK